MAETKLRGVPCRLSGELPAVGESAPDFLLVRRDLAEVSLADYRGRRVVMNIYPSIDTSVCARSVKMFEEELSSREDLVLLHVAADLPFAASRFCGAEGIDNADVLSTFRGTFLTDYGVEMVEGALKGLAARAVLVLDGEGKVLHQELVGEISEEPDYEAAIAVL